MELMKWAAKRYGQAGITLVLQGYTKAQILSLMVPHTPTGCGHQVDDWREQA